MVAQLRKRKSLPYSQIQLQVASFADQFEKLANYIAHYEGTGLLSQKSGTRIMASSTPLLLLKNDGVFVGSSLAINYVGEVRVAQTHDLFTQLSLFFVTAE